MTDTGQSDVLHAEILRLFPHAARQERSLPRGLHTQPGLVLLLTLCSDSPGSTGTLQAPLILGAEWRNDQLIFLLLFQDFFFARLQDTNRRCTTSVPVFLQARSR